VAFLDERYPARPVIPRDPALRARALLYEEGFDEGLGRTVQPIRWMIAANARRTSARFRAAYGTGFLAGLRMALVTRFLRLDMRRKYGGRTLGAPPAATLLIRLGEVLDTVDAALAETGWLVGSTPSVADFALYGWLSQLDGLDGWDAVQARQRVARLMQTLADPAQEATGVGERGGTPSLDDRARRAERTDDPPPTP
jgi:glutathione S-transferase